MTSAQLIPGTMLDSDPQALFASIHEQFKNALPKDIQRDFLGFKDPADMLDKFKQLVKDSQSRSVKTRRAMTLTAKLADKLGPYFEVVNIFVQSHPEYAALVWGTLRFILLIAKNYTTFLSKIEIMLLRMTATMPDFQLFMSKLRGSKVISATDFMPRLTQALAWTYSDILEFCHRICTLLYPQQKGEPTTPSCKIDLQDFMRIGLKSKWKLFSNMAFKPFDAHFAETIERFERHSELFMNLMNTTSTVVAFEFYNEWETHMSQVHASLGQMANQQQSQGKGNDKILMNAAISELQQRVGAPAWATTFEHARSHRVDESGEWLLAHPLMAEHMGNNTATSSRKGNVLFLYGKPGYGKTTLATVVVDHLRETASLRGNSGPSSLAFFFFDRQSRFNSSHDAFRALLAQLIFCRRFDQIVLDIAAIARPDHDTGQQSASDDEVFAILHLFLLQFSTCDLVCDGVDECEDRDNFLAKMSRLATDHEKCQFFLFSRPIIKIPKELRNRCSVLQMDPTQNLEDLTSFIYPQVEELVDSGDLVLSGDSSVDDVVSSICSRSNGMFLWAVLFLGYLKLPSLSVSQRRDALQDSGKFDGLFSLYDGILAFIEKEYPRLSRRNIRRAISWVLGAFRPLKVNELRTAIAQMDYKAFDEADTIPNFEKSIGPMTGALIEITGDETVRLIHITVAEYLVSNSETIPPSFCDETILDFKGAVVQHHLATTCLSYLMHTVPSGPYVDRYSENSDFASNLKEYPLFSYATQFWPAHLRDATEKSSDTSNINALEVLEELGRHAASFLSDKTQFTSWIEALWHLYCPQEAWAVEFLDWEVCPHISAKSTIRGAAILLHLAFQEHAKLVECWGNVLEKYPEELWQPSISAFSESKLRKISTAAQTSSVPFNAAHDQNSVILQTKCSSSGHAIAILHAKYRSEYSQHHCAASLVTADVNSVPNYIYQSEAPPDFSPITVTYEIRSLSDEQMLFETSIEVPRRDFIMLDGKNKADLFHQRDDKFSIETSISTTLMEAVIGSTLLKLAVSMEESGPEFQCTKHILGFLNDTSGFRRPQRLQSSGKSKSAWKLFLSPGAEFLLLLRGGNGTLGSEQDRNAFTVDIFQDPRYRRSPTKPKFAWVAWKIIAPKARAEYDKPTSVEYWNHTGALDTTESPFGDKSLYVQSRASELESIMDGFIQSDDVANHNSKDAEAEPILHFHPTLPQIIYSYSSGTYLWNFCSLLHSTIHEVYQEHIQVHHSALSNIRIADSGNMLYGFESVANKERVVILDLRSHQGIFGKESISPAHFQVLDTTSSVVQHLEHFSRADLVREASSQAQPSGTAMIVLNPSGTPALSVLRQSKDDGSLVQETFDAEGNTRARHILHLPSSISRDADVALLGPGESGSQAKSKPVKVLLGVHPKSSYSFQEGAAMTLVGEPLPAVFHRDKSSIRTVRGQIQHTVEGCSAPRALDSSTPEQSKSAAWSDNEEQEIEAFYEGDVEYPRIWSDEDIA